MQKTQVEIVTKMSCMHIIHYTLISLVEYRYIPPAEDLLVG